MVVRLMAYKSNIPLIANSLDTAFESVLKETAEAIASSARDRVPVNTGALRDSIEAREGTFTAGARSKFASVAAEFGVAPPTGKGVRAYDAYGVWMAWYGIFVEYGTVKEAPRPFMIPAAEEHRATLRALGTVRLRHLIK
jgi:HK97 gp10 family phage protein